MKTLNIVLLWVIALAFWASVAFGAYCIWHGFGSGDHGATMFGALCVVGGGLCALLMTGLAMFEKHVKYE